MENGSSGFSRVELGAQEVVFSTGDLGEDAFVIEQGCVEVLAGTAPKQSRVAVLAEGAMFGEVALLDRQPRTATVRALVPTTLVRINRAHVEELLGRADPVIQYLLNLLLERFRSSRPDAIRPDGSNALAVGAPAATTAAVDLHAAAVRTLSLAHDLSDAIEGGQLALFYQPIVALQERERVGFEALVRWRHPRLGLISPDEFIPLAEKTGLIHRIGHWVLHQAALDWQQLRTICREVNGLAPFMAVNLSAPELSAEGIVERIQQRIAAQKMAPGELRIELTETIIISNVGHVTRSVQALRELGIGIALDDFGTGYAGLDYLQTLPFSCLKIDKTFVQQMHSAERSFQIVRSALELSRTLGLTTVAEGIEDLATADELQALGCTYAQGYYFGRPLPLAQALAGKLP